MTTAEEVEIDRLNAEIERLLAQLPEGMKNCTIQFKECKKGHGWLTATNWVQHGCQTCELERLRAAFDQALYSLCCENYEEQQIVADKLKNLMPTKGG